MVGTQRAASYKTIKNNNYEKEIYCTFNGGNKGTGCQYDSRKYGHVR